MARKRFYKTELKAKVLRALVVYDFLPMSWFYPILGIPKDKKGVKSNEARYLRDLLPQMVIDGILERGEVIDKPNDGSWSHREYAYWMTKKGYAWAKEQGLDPKGIGHGWTYRSPVNHEHSKKRSAIHFTLNRTLGIEIKWNHSNTWHRFKHGKKRYTFSPDDMAFIGENYFVIEVENSKKGDHRPDGTGILDKLDKIERYADPAYKVFKEKFPGMEFFYGLLFSWDLDSRESLRKKLPSGRYVVANFDDFIADPLGKVFRNRENKEVSLKELANL